MKKTERIHSLDALRAIMMLMGLALHSALTYNVTNHGDVWPIKDTLSTHIFSDFLVHIIHSFRMQLFFLVSGFFGAMLFYERQMMKMIKNRFSRIAMPFVVFVVILFPIIEFFYTYTNAVLTQQQNPLDVALGIFTGVSSFLPTKTTHLWFLYYMVQIIAASVIMGVLLRNKRITKYITVVFDWLIQRAFARVVLFIIINFIILTLINTSMVDTSISIIPDPKTFIYYLAFYLIGWVLYKSKQHLNCFMRYDWAFTIAGIVVAAVHGMVITHYNLAPNENSVMMILFSSVTVSLFSSGVTGLFVRYASDYSARMKYLMDSSYWIYIIHVPVTAIIPAFVADLPLPAVGKFLIVLFVTTIICFASYHYFVRYTFIGKFLNGVKYTRETKKKLVTSGIIRLSQIFR